MAGPFLIVFALFWSAFVFYFDGRMGHDAYDQYESGSFPSVTGTVTRSRVEQHTGSKGRTYYVAMVNYTYNVSGQSYRGDRLRFGTSPERNAYAIVNAHPSNSPVQVYYNPQNPNESLLYPGITGSDLMPALFITPFNMVMIGIWLAAYVWLRERLFKPVAGGVKIIADGMTTRVRLPTLGAVVCGLGTTGLFGFFSVLALLIGTGSQPSVAAVLVTFAAVYLAGAGVWFWQQQKINSGIDDLVINEASRTLELPLTFGRKERVTLPFTDIETLWVDIVEHHGSKGGTSYTYAPTLILRNKSDNQKLADWGDQLRANDFADWLSKKVGVSTGRAGVAFDR
jgi:hypothetical protein